ncbi:caspase domain-containing protein [Mycena leptocephala]|nr:caspase domain-containing protein [Mycena leptocephala]
MLNNPEKSVHAPREKHAGTFALIIGIDDYFKTGDLPPLRGAVNDARLFEKYLLDLHVPSTNIVVLENKNATRSAILSAFNSHLLDNSNIPDHGDAMMILFFAGHGSRFKAPSDLIAPGRMIEAICPVDERTKNNAGEYVHAIPDYVLVWLLAELAGKKGINIAVILDCCHSAGMERDLEGTRTARSDSCAIPLDLDSHFWKGKTDTARPHRMWSRPLHVVLAACLAGETAREVQHTDGMYYGRFTLELVPLLQETPLESVTWAELLNWIKNKKWPGQTPYCGGTRSNRLFFNGNYPAAGRRSVLLTPQKSSRFKSASSSELFKFRVEMGSVEGVVPDTEFAAYDRNNDFLGTFVAKSVQVGQTILVWKPENDQPPMDIPPWSRAVVSDWKSSPLLVYTPADFLHKSVLFPTTVNPPNFVPAPCLEKAHLVVRSDGGVIVIEARMSTVLAGQPKPRFALSDPAHLPHAIDGVAHFSYFLDRANEADQIEGVALEMHRLLGEYPFCRPDLQDGNRIKDGEVRLMSEIDTQYGFTIRNTSDENLFPYLFYFDLETYTIQNWYSPAGVDVEPPLPSGGMVTIGMGSERAFNFTLLPGELSSCGFLKLFMTTEYIDLGWIPQELSPFDPRFEGTGRLRISHEPLDLRTTSDKTDRIVFSLSPLDLRLEGIERLGMSKEPLDLRKRSDAMWDALTVTLIIAAQ